MVQAIIKALEVNVRGIDRRGKISKGRFVDVTGRFEKVFDPLAACQDGRIVYVFIKRYRLGIGIGDGGTSGLLALGYDLLGWQVHVVRLPWTELGYLPVLTVEATKITAGGSDGEGSSSREKVKEGFFLDRVNVDGTGIAIGDGVQFSLMTPPVATEAEGVIGEKAFMGAFAALDPL